VITGYKRAAAIPILSQWDTHHQRVHMSVQDVTEKKEAGHDDLPQIVSDHLASSCQIVPLQLSAHFNFSTDRGCYTF
jgi:hypothetical protein